MYAVIIWVRWVKILSQRLYGTHLGVLQQNSIPKYVNPPDHTIPYPLPTTGGITRTIAYIKGLRAVNRPIFRLYILTPNKVTLNTRKSKNSAILCHFIKQLHPEKEPGQTEITQSAQAYFFRIGGLDTLQR